MKYLQQILIKEKKYLDNRECRNPPKLPKTVEFSVKTIVDKYILDSNIGLLLPN